MKVCLARSENFPTAAGWGECEATGARALFLHEGEAWSPVRRGEGNELLQVWGEKRRSYGQSETTHIPGGDVGICEATAAAVGPRCLPRNLEAGQA